MLQSLVGWQGALQASAFPPAIVGSPVGLFAVLSARLLILTPPLGPCRQKILKEKAVPMIEGYMFEEHEMIRRAATECMSNLAMSKEVCWDCQLVGRGFPCW